MVRLETQIAETKPSGPIAIEAATFDGHNVNVTLHNTSNDLVRVSWIHGDVTFEQVGETPLVVVPLAFTLKRINIPDHGVSRDADGWIEERHIPVADDLQLEPGERSTLALHARRRWRLRAQDNGPDSQPTYTAERHPVAAAAVGTNTRRIGIDVGTGSRFRLSVHPRVGSARTATSTVDLQVVASEAVPSRWCWRYNGVSRITEICPSSGP